MYHSSEREGVVSKDTILRVLLRRGDKAAIKFCEKFVSPPQPKGRGWF
jgi:hypothetical protein